MQNRHFPFSTLHSPLGIPHSPFPIHIFLLCSVVISSCSFIPDNPTYFIQQPVPTFILHTVVSQTFGAAPADRPQFAFAYQVYFADPVSSVIEAISPVDFFPAQLSTRCSEILSEDMLNRGFAMGYGDYVLGVAFLVSFDDLNHNDVYDAGEPIIGSAPDEVMVYLQGTPSRELLDQFGALQ